MIFTKEEGLEYIKEIMDAHDLRQRDRIRSLFRAIRKSDASARRQKKIIPKRPQIMPGFDDVPFRDLHGDGTQDIRVQVYRVEEPDADHQKKYLRHVGDLLPDDDLEDIQRQFGPGTYRIRQCLSGQWRKEYQVIIGPSPFNRSGR